MLLLLLLLLILLLLLLVVVVVVVVVLVRGQIYFLKGDGENDGKREGKENKTNPFKIFLERKRGCQSRSDSCV